MTRGAFTRINSPHAKQLRHDMTEAETRLWFHLRNRRLSGFKFRRQVTIDPYIVDFLCIEKRLVVEVDGSQHGDERDAARTLALEVKGYRVIRFWNNDVLARTDQVLEAILAALEGR